MSSAVNYFTTTDGHGFAMDNPFIHAVEFGKSTDYSKASRQMSALVTAGLMSQEQYTGLMTTLRDKGIGMAPANDNPSWADRILAENRDNSRSR